MSGLPADWRVETIASLAQGGLFVDGDWVESKDQDTAGGVRLTQLADVGVGVFRDRSDRWMRDDQAERLNCTFIEPGDVLIARMPDPIGRACLAPDNLGRAVTAVDVAILRHGRDDVDSRYLMWAINSPQVHERIARLQSGTTRKRVSRKNLATVQVPVPPFAEQRRIVEILEDHLSRLEAGTSMLSKSIKRLDALVAAEASSALAAAGGNSVALGSIVNGLSNGIFVSRAGAEPDGVPILRIGAVRSLTLDLSAVGYSRLTEAEVRGRGADLQPGDLLFTRYNGNPNYVGAVARVPEGTGVLTYPDKLIRVRVDRDRVLPEFVEIAASFGMTREQIRSKVKTSAGQAGISGRELKGVTLRLPALDDQVEVVRRTNTILGTARRLQQQLERAERRAETLRQTTLAAAFSGKLTGANSDFERIEQMAETRV